MKKKHKRRKKLKFKKVIYPLPIISSVLIIISIFIIIFFFKQVSQMSNQTIDKSVKTKEKFIERVNLYAQKNYEKYNILPSVTISQAIVESDWGKSTLSAKYHNYFGIKSINKSDKRVVFETIEYIDGKPVVIKDAFGVFMNLEDSVRYHGLLLGTTKTYERVANAKDYKTATKMLYECGYATDKNYSNILNEIIEQYELYKYDVKK